MKQDVIVIGAGLAGTTTAWFLAQRGLRVTVLERRDHCGLETSFANGALLTPSEADPWNAPGTFLRMLRWLGREDSPLLLRPRALPGMLAWGLKFLSASRPHRHSRSTRANLRLALYSQSILDELDRNLGIEYDRLHNGTLKIFRDRKSLKLSVELADALRALGLDSRVLSAEQAVAMEPMLGAIARQLAGAIHYPSDGSGDAHLFTSGMHQHAVNAGVSFRFKTSVTKIHAASGRILRLETGEGEVEADHYVLAAGSYSPLLAKPLGLRLPIYPVKGYSVSITPADSHSLRTPLVDFERKVVIAPLGRVIRVAGTAEFTGYDTSLNPSRCANILRQAVAILPWLEDPGRRNLVTYWTGLRPMTCDGPPILGATPYANLFLNTGHGPLGWTLCAGSAKCVAELVAGAACEIEMQDFSCRRFQHAG
ncbi:MAG: D-amino acid dehydrogenase [Gammaproteobacteria bacterium]|nr:D-amino acid dehydrogenase [Gammaproteobacteria bacterium]MDE2346094.1 D-amino acid dehydrogenase [Gammaproteobacteria bacterium]